MRFRTFQHDAPTGKINVTPLIDVIMVLIVFYLIVGRLATQTQGRVNLPETPAGDTARSQGVVIVVSAGEAAPRIMLDGRDVAIDSLKDALLAKLPELVAGETQQTQVQLRADRSLSYGDVAPIVQVCRDAGLTNLELVSTRSGAGGTP